MGGDHLLFNEWEDYDIDEDNDECDYCDGTGKYWETNKEGKWIKVACICSEPQI